MSRVLGEAEVVDAAVVAEFARRPYEREIAKLTRIRAHLEDDLAELADQPRWLRWHLKMAIKAFDRRIQTLKGVASE
jgi:hypothetical protein